MNTNREFGRLLRLLAVGLLLLVNGWRAAKVDSMDER